MQKFFLLASLGFGTPSKSMTIFGVLLILVAFPTVYTQIICDPNQQKDIYLDFDEIAFFETPNFPENPTDACYINFWLNTTDSTVTVRSIKLYSGDQKFLSKIIFFDD